MSKGDMPYHPRQCHLCRYNGVNALLAERGLPLCPEAERACLSCRDPGLPNDGVSWVHLDAAASPDSVCAGRIAPECVQCGGEDAPECVPCGGEAREMALDLLRRFGALPYDSAGVVCGMLAGKTLTQIASETRQSVQSLHAKWKRACAADPTWRAIENGMMGKGLGRKPKGGGRRRTFDAEARAALTQAEMEF